MAESDWVGWSLVEGLSRGTLPHSMRTRLLEGAAPHAARGHPQMEPRPQEAGPPTAVPPPTWKPLTASFHASSRSSSSRVTCFSARPSMALGKSSRYLRKGGDGESGQRGSPALPMPPSPYHRSRASSCPWGPARARSTSPWSARMAAQRLGSSQPHSPQATAMFKGRVSEGAGPVAGRGL